MKRFLKRSMLVLGIVLVAWIIIAPSCMTMRTADDKMKKEFEKDSVTLFTKTDKINNHSLHYAYTGSDTMPTIIFIHGTPGSWDAFAPYLKDKSLLKQYRLVSIDRPGFGYSDFGKAWNLQEQADIMDPFLRSLKNGKPMFIVGHSLGGPVVVKLTADNPELFAATVIISGSIDPAEEKPEKWRPWLFKTPLNLLVPGAFKQSNEEIWIFKKDLVSLQAEYKKIHTPIYFIHGRKDTWVPPGNVDYGRKMLVNASAISTLYFDDGNHFIPWTKFEAIRDMLLHLTDADEKLNRPTTSE